MRKPRRLIALAAGLAATAAVLAHPGIAKAANYSVWQGIDGLCMGVQGGNMAPGTAIISWQCDGTNNQLWSEDFSSGAPNTFLLRNLANPNECLSVFEKATYLDAPLVIWPCKAFNDNQDQRWSRADTFSAPIYNFNSGLQILPGGFMPSGQGAAIVQWDGRVPYPWTASDFVTA